MVPGIWVVIKGYVSIPKHHRIRYTCHRSGSTSTFPSALQMIHPLSNHPMRGLTLQERDIALCTQALATSALEKPYEAKGPYRNSSLKL